MTMRSVSIIALAAAAACPAFAQPIVPVSQVRLISGGGQINDPAGNMTFGPHLVQAPENLFGPWAGDLALPGQFNYNASQEGGLVGDDRIQLNHYAMSMGGGGGPGTSGSSQMRNEFTYTFTVAAGSTFVLNSNIGCAGPFGPPATTNNWSVSISLVQGTTDVFRFQTGFENNFNLLVENYAGTLDGGTYTLSLVGTGEVTFDGGDTGAGTGGGAGGTDPSMSFVVTAPPASCAADLGVAGGEPGQDGVLDNNDFIAFINYFFAQDTHADLGVAGGEAGSDGAWDNNDFIAFINLFFSGC